MATQITHYIDRQYGHPIHLGTESGIIKFVAKTQQGEKFDAKFSALITGLTIEEAKKELKDLFTYHMNIIKFDTPLLTKIEDYK